MFGFFTRRKEGKGRKSPRGPEQVGTLEEAFEGLLASKMRLEILERSTHNSASVIDKEGMMLAAAGIKTSGDVFYVGDGVVAVVGDAEIPDGSTLDKSLVVKGKVKVGANCLILRNLKALGRIVIADRCTVRANVASGDSIELGEDTVVEGDVHAKSTVRLSEGAGIRGLVDAQGLYAAGKKR